MDYFELVLEVSQIVHLPPDEVEARYDLDMLEKLFIWSQNKQKKDNTRLMNIIGWTNSDQEKLSSRILAEKLTKPISLTGEPDPEPEDYYYG